MSYPGESVIWPYFQQLFDDPSKPTVEPMSSNILKGSLSNFGFSFLQTILEMGQETGIMQIHDKHGEKFAFLELESGEIENARLNTDPFLSKDAVLEFFARETPGNYHFLFHRNQSHTKLAEVI